jgi:hypothetical protein
MTLTMSKTGLHDLTTPAGRYGRYSNPTWLDVERRISELTGAESSLLFASGMAAHFTTFVPLLKAGDEVVLPAESYRQVRNVFHAILPKFGIIVHEISIRDSAAFLDGIQALAGRLRLVHLEMPSSPHMYLIDVAQVREIVGPEVVITGTPPTSSGAGPERSGHRRGRRPAQGPVHGLELRGPADAGRAEHLSPISGTTKRGWRASEWIAAPSGSRSAT